MDRVRGASGDASATVDTAFRINVHLGRILKGRLVCLWVDAISGTHFDTKGVCDAGIGNDVSLDESISTNGMSASVLIRSL